MVVGLRVKSQLAELVISFVVCFSILQNHYLCHLAVIVAISALVRYHASHGGEHGSIPSSSRTRHPIQSANGGTSDGHRIKTLVQRRRGGPQAASTPEKWHGVVFSGRVD